jgi:hypothetical protein
LSSIVIEMRPFVALHAVGVPGIELAAVAGHDGQVVARGAAGEGGGRGSDDQSAHGISSYRVQITIRSTNS